VGVVSVVLTRVDYYNSVLTGVTLSQLIVPTITRCSTLGDWTFAVATARAWNALPPDFAMKALE